MRTITYFFPLALTSIFLVAGCTLAGERASGALGPDGTPRCPSGETCSSLTPNGLFFLGTATSDGFGAAIGVPRTAIGGTQTVTVHIDADVKSATFTHPFEAQSADTSVLTVASSMAPTFVLHGEAEGSSMVRLINPDTQELFDRVELKSEAITGVSLHPNEFWIADVKPWALLGGSTTSLTIGLEGKPEGDTKARLIDESMKVGAGGVSLTKKAWDVVELKAPASGELALQITAGGKSFAAKAAVVAAVEDIVAYPSGDPATTKLNVTVDGSTLLCFLARAGEKTVAGASWSFEPGSGVEMESMSDHDAPTSVLPECLSLRGTTAGMSTLKVTASGVTKAFDLTVSPMPKMLQGGAQPAWMSGWMSGWMKSGSGLPSRPLPTLLGGERAREASAE